MAKIDKELEKQIREMLEKEFARYEARMRELIRGEITKWNRGRVIPRHY